MSPPRASPVTTACDRPLICLCPQPGAPTRPEARAATEVVLRNSFRGARGKEYPELWLYAASREWRMRTPVVNTTTRSRCHGLCAPLVRVLLLDDATRCGAVPVPYKQHQHRPRHTQILCGTALTRNPERCESVCGGCGRRGLGVRVWSRCMKQFRTWRTFTAMLGRAGRVSRLVPTCGLGPGGSCVISLQKCLLFSQRRMSCLSFSGRRSAPSIRYIDNISLSCR